MKDDPLFVIQAVLFLVLLSAASVIDIKSRVIPNPICIAIALTGLLCFSPIKLLGILAAMPFLLAGICCGGIGGGDIKLTASAGLVMGLKGAMAGTVLGLSAMLLFHLLRRISQRSKGLEIEVAYPLAPYLSLGFLVIYFLTLGGIDI
ncbi:MAG: prepilin peptidase [Clostridia bacterium]|nr:prepilin peptidase [Clostridia bacterium]